MPTPKQTDDAPRAAGKTAGTLRGIGDTKPVDLREQGATTEMALSDEGPSEPSVDDVGVSATASVGTDKPVPRSAKEAFLKARREFLAGIDASKFAESDIKACEDLLRKVYYNQPLQEALAVARAELKPGQRLGQALPDMLFGEDDEVRDVQESDRKESVVVTAKVRKRSRLDKKHRDTILEATNALKKASPEALKTASVSLGLSAEPAVQAPENQEIQFAASFFDRYYRHLPKTVGGRTAQLPIPEAVAKYTAEKPFTDFAAGPNPHRNITGTLNGAPSPVAVDEIAADGRAETPAAVPEATGSAPGRRSAPTVPDISAADGTTPQEPQAPLGDGTAGSKWAAQAPSDDAAESIDPAVFPSAMAPEIMTTAVNLKAPALDGVDDAEDDGDAPTAPSFLQNPVGRLKPLWYTLAAVGTVALVVILFNEFSAPDPAPVTRQPVEATPPVSPDPDVSPSPVDENAAPSPAPANDADLSTTGTVSAPDPKPPTKPPSARSAAVPTSPPVRSPQPARTAQPQPPAAVPAPPAPASSADGRPSIPPGFR